MNDPKVQAVLDAALAVHNDYAECGLPTKSASLGNLAAAVAVYRASQTPTCPDCHGRGCIRRLVNVPGKRAKSYYNEWPCSACGGSGVTPNPQEAK